MAKINRIHDIVAKGDLQELQNILKPSSRVTNTKLLSSKDLYGEGLLHKAVSHGYFELTRWLLDTCPDIVHVKDKFDRTALHYAPLCQDPQLAWTTLVQAGVNPTCKDKFGKMAKFYMDNPSMVKLARSPWEKDPGRYTSANQAFTIKPSNIRIWIHDQDLNRLIRVIWEGHGSKLLCETSRQPTVKRFLESIPFIMGTVRDIHQSVTQNNLSRLIQVSAEPVPNEALSSKDIHGLSPLHKASGLGFKDIVEYLLSKVDDMNQVDNFGRTPLHYAAMKSGNIEVYKLLKNSGAKENIQDSKGKLAKHYLTKPSDRPEASLSFVPSAPRTVDQFPMSWDWDLYKTKPRVLIKSRSSLQAEKENEDYLNTRKTKSEGNLHKLPVKRKVKKMFEEDFVPAKTQTQADTLDMDQYKEMKAVRRSHRRRVEDTTTTDSDVEDNIDTRIGHHRSRSKTIGGPMQSRNTNGITNNDVTSNLTKPLDKSVSHMDLGIRNVAEVANHLPDPFNGYPSATHRSASKDEAKELDIDSSNKNDYRTSYRNYPMFEDPILNEFRQPYNSNYETKNEPYGTPVKNNNTIINDTNPHQEVDIGNNTINDNDTEPRKNAQVDDEVMHVDQNDRKSGKKDGKANNANLESKEIHSERKEDQQVMDESSSTDKNSSIVSTEEVQVNTNKENKIHNPSKRRRRNLMRDDSRIIVNTFSSIEDMQKNIQDEEEENEEKTIDKPDEKLDEKKDTDIPKDAPKKKIKERVIVNTFNSIEDMRKAICDEEQENMQTQNRDGVSSQLPGNANSKVPSESFASDEKAEKYNEFYYEQKSTVDNLEQNRISKNLDDTVDLRELENTSFSKLIKDKSIDNDVNEQKESGETTNNGAGNYSQKETGSAGTRERLKRDISVEDNGDAILRNTYNLNLIDNRDINPLPSTEPETNGNVVDNVGENSNESKEIKGENKELETVNIEPEQNDPSSSKDKNQNKTSDSSDDQKDSPQDRQDDTLETENIMPHGRHDTEVTKPDESIPNIEESNIQEKSKNQDHNFEEDTRKDKHLDEITHGSYDEGNELNDYDKNQRIEELIEEGDLEKLADLILEGDGDLLRGKQSNHPEVQRFLTNVPSYMAKIKKIHHACQKGDLREVLHNLDRRKFAVGRENWTGLRMTPLHVAVLYRNSAIVRYLAARFPESLHARDIHGRTPLHYAATLPDKTFYNLLLTLGAYPTLLDNKDLSPSDYIESKETCYKSLIALYENNPDIYEMERKRSELESSRDVVSANQTATLFISEEGRYLASAVGDPLILGLKELIKERPISPVKFLANFLIQFEHLKNNTGQIENIPNGLPSDDPNTPTKKATEPRDKTVTISSKRKPISDHLVNVPMGMGGTLMNGEKGDEKEESVEKDETRKQEEEEQNIVEKAKLSEENIPDNVVDKDPTPEQTQPDVPDSGNTLPEEEPKDDVDPTDDVDSRRGTAEKKQLPVEDGFGNDGSSRNSEQDSDDDEEGAGKTSFKNVNRDDHGQSPIHFAASRSQGRNALSQLMEELDANIAYRDELYRTPRDLAEENGLHSNVVAIDKHVFQMGARGETEKLLDLLLEGYEHILDLDIEEDIVQEVIKRGHAMTLSLLQSIPTFEERREKLHRAIRLGSDSIVKEMLNKEAKDAKLLAVGKNNRGRCCLHIAILSAQENIVKIISSQFPLTLNIGDNLERTSLHYAMGVAQVETLSTILIQAGAQRTIKDLKGRTATYYFMNKSAIRALQEEENILRV